MSFLDFINLNSPLVPHGERSDLNFIHLTFAENRHDSIPVIARAGYLLFLRGTWYVFLLMAVYGMVGMWKKRRKEATFLLAILFYWWGVYSLVHALPRYAIAIYPRLIYEYSLLDEPFARD